METFVFFSGFSLLIITFILTFTYNPVDSNGLYQASSLPLWPSNDSLTNASSSALKSSSGHADLFHFIMLLLLL